MMLLPGQNVTSSSGCYTTSCNLQNNEPKLFVDKPNCPILNCAVQFQVRGEDGCCNVCPKPATLKMCAPVPVSDTAGMVREEVGGHGVCTNAQPVTGWTECKGTCFSGTRYSHEAKGSVTNCTCCQAQGEREVTVQLQCNDGFTLSRTMTVPRTCACQSCDQPFPIAVALQEEHPGLTQQQEEHPALTQQQEEHPALTQNEQEVTLTQSQGLEAG